MYLKEIVASGFKSFADKLDMKLDGDITCIVGPNGSGKSNIVDAVRWVLGEQSVKSLRGDGSMSDVIFSGSKSRKALNVASVELIFDNTDQFIQVPYTEISIKRKVFRSGENEYYLNNERCRLKDINDLLMDSGMGRESFNIISQGEVDKILSNSPNDRRVIFEEAAGILKYRKRKEEALRKLDRTHSNIDRLNDILNEITTQLEPLKEQSKRAEEYLGNKKGLDKYEVSLLVYDIFQATKNLQEEKEKKEKIDKEILNLTGDTSLNDIQVTKDQEQLDKLEMEKKTLNSELLNVVKEVEQLNGERKLLKERSKNEDTKDSRKLKLRNLLEEKSNINSEITLLEEEIKSVIENSKTADNETSRLKEGLDKVLVKIKMSEADLKKIDREKITAQHKIESLTFECEQGGYLPTGVQSVLKQPSLLGIHNTIANVLKVDEKYNKALEIALSSSKNFIITSDEDSAKRAISYLKENRLGRATFFPLTVIKSRYVDEKTLQVIRENPTFLGIMSDLVTYDRKYKNIIENQLGTVLVVKDIDSGLLLSRQINNRYKIVTLDGDVIHVGGSMSGGSSYQSKSILSLKRDIDYLKTEIEKRGQTQKELEKELETLQEERKEFEQKIFRNSQDKVVLKEKYDTKKKKLLSKKEDFASLNREWESLQMIDAETIDKREQELIEAYHEKEALREKIEMQIKELEEKTSKLKTSIEEETAFIKVKSASLRNAEKKSQDIEIAINRLDVKIDAMLNTLNEDYELTYEKAKDTYLLDIEPNDAREKVNRYKANIKRIGMVNLSAIEEYERINTRYEFLMNQKEDLLNAENSLLEIMNEMDEVMKSEFANTFLEINQEFQNVFQELFGGGTASLKLTDPKDLLSTGVEIVASPPGKKLTTISLLSGGEKTLTAISLLFAILNVRPTPFCLFDEVEAALDEANVLGFGKYLDHYKNKTQILIITHKKKTMEYAHTLYGITMQESGVSKLVSVKLEEYK